VDVDCSAQERHRQRDRQRHTYSTAYSHRCTEYRYTEYGVGTYKYLLDLTGVTLNFLEWNENTGYCILVALALYIF
jgi:hypothetical protein